MKTEIITITTFACMVLIMCIQALLHGSWRVIDTRPIESDRQ